jgi:hypothetical protein
VRCCDVLRMVGEVVGDCGLGVGFSGASKELSGLSDLICDF